MPASHSRCWHRSGDGVPMLMRLARRSVPTGSFVSAVVSTLWSGGTNNGSFDSELLCVGNISMVRVSLRCDNDNTQVVHV